MASTPARDAPGGARTASLEHDFINSLPDECIVDILSRLAQEKPPTLRSTLAVHHPIHCALVCRRWAALVDGSVTHLHIEENLMRAERLPVPASLGQRLAGFSALRSLHFVDIGISAILRALSLGACPRLSSFHYRHRLGGTSPGLDGAELAGALRSCLLLQDLNVRVGYMHNDGDLRLAIRGLPLLESLTLDIIDCDWSGRGLHDVHKGMSQLKSLDIAGRNQLVRVVSSAEGLPLLEKLALRFVSCGGKLPVSLGRLSTLRSLSLEVTYISSIPSSISQLHNLRTLDITTGAYLKVLPESLGALWALESLSVSGCCNMVGLPASLGSLSALKRLFLMDCSSLKSLPESFSMLTSLETLTVGEGCCGIRTLPETLGSLQRLSALALDTESLTCIPESIGLLTGLRSLSLSATRLTQLPASMGRLSALDKLAIYGNVKLPEELGDLRALSEVTLRECTRIPKPLRRLQALASLEVHSHEGIVPEGIERLTRLQVFSFHATLMALLPDCLLRMPSLGRVSVCNLWRAEAGHPSLAILDKLHAQGVRVERGFCDLHLP